MPPPRLERLLRPAVVSLVTVVLTLAPGASGASGVAATVREDVARVQVADFERMRQVDVRWSPSLGTDLPVPRGTRVLRLALPSALRDLHLDPATLLLVADARSRPGYATTSAGLRMDGWEIVVDLPTVVAAVQGGAAAAPSEVRLLVRDPDPADDSLDATVVLRLTDDPATGDVRLELPLPPGEALMDRRQHRGGLVLARPGARVVFAAEPGFWDTVWAVGADDQTTGTTVSLRDSIEVSQDGSVLTVRMPQTPTGADSLRIEARGIDRREHTVWVGLHRPSSDPVEAYVQQVYADLFDRLPDHYGLWDWTAALKGGVRYGAVADGITYSREFRAGLIQDAYSGYLGREPDPQGLVNWLDAMDRGLHIQQMEAGFLASPEHYVRAGGTDRAWLHAVYADVLGRTPTPAEVAGWLPEIHAAGRTAVARAVLYSSERLTAVVEGYYRWLLGRGLDPTGQRGWVTAIQAGHRSEEIVAGIIASDEYRAKVWKP